MNCRDIEEQTNGELVRNIVKSTYRLFKRSASFTNLAKLVWVPVILT